MKREELIAMGISEENVEKIIADYGSAVQREQAKAAELKAKADSADELQKKLDEMEAGNLTELEKANKALETANQQIADMQKIRDQREALMEKLKINAEQAKSVVKDNGSLDYDALGKITAEKETAAAQAKEQEIANNSENPGGGTAGGENKKTADVENAEKISFGKPAESAEAKDHYVL